MWRDPLKRKWPLIVGGGVLVAAGVVIVAFYANPRADEPSPSAVPPEPAPVAATEVTEDNRIAVDCNITASDHLVAGGVRLRRPFAESSVSVTISMSGRPLEWRWWGSGLQHRDEERGMWKPFRGNQHPLLFGGEYGEYYVLIEGRENERSLRLNRVTGEVSGELLVPDNAVRVFSGSCSPGTFTPPPERRF